MRSPCERKTDPRCGTRGSATSARRLSPICLTAVSTSSSEVAADSSHSLCRRTPLDPAQQFLRDLLPFLFERQRRYGLAGAAIPIRGVPRIAFLPVQVRVNPRGFGVVDILRNFVRRVPVALRIVPQRKERRWKLCG